MDGVKRYALSYYNECGGYSPKMVEVHTLPEPETREVYWLESDALAREAALREELASKTAMLEAEQKWFDKEIDSADEETSALRECIRDLKDWREHSQSLSAFASIIARAEAVVPAPGPLRKRLTAAEQELANERERFMNTVDQLATSLAAAEQRNAYRDRDAGRYRKLQLWMASNVKDGWAEVEKMGGICAWMSCGDMDEYLDRLPDCNIGLCAKPTESGASE